MHKLFVILIFVLIALNAYSNNDCGDLYNNACITVNHTEATPGNTANVSVVANGFGNINVYESRIVFNPEVLDFLSINDLHPAISNSSSNIINDSIFAIGWFGFPAQLIEDGATLFTLQFQFCCDLFSCAENDTESHVNVVENTAFIGLFNPDFTFTQTQLDFTNGAVFSPTPLRILTIDQTDEGTVLVNEQTYTQPVVAEEQTQLNLEAVPGIGFGFSHWSGDLESDDNPASLLLNSDKHLTTTFLQLAGPFDFSINHTGQGSVFVNGAPYSEPLHFYHTNTIFLEAIPSEGYAFSGWHDQHGNMLSENPEYVYHMPDENVAITAHFDLKTFTVTASAGEGGSIDPAGTLNPAWSSDLSFLITPDAGFAIADVLVDGTSVGITEQYSFTGITSNHSIHTVFQLITHTITFFITDAEMGTVIPDAEITFDGIEHEPGLYVFEEIEPGSYQYTVHKEGYEAISASVTVTDDTDIVVAMNPPDESDLPDSRTLQGVIIKNGASVCYDALHDIFVGGNDHTLYFFVESGGETSLIAGESITFFPGTTVEHGGYLHASISDDGLFCFRNFLHNEPIENVADNDYEKTTHASFLKNEHLLLRIYPNPATSKINIEVLGSDSCNIVQVEIFSIIGESVFNKQLSPHNRKHTLDISCFPTGMYLVRAIAGNEACFQRLIIKKGL